LLTADVGEAGQQFLLSQGPSIQATVLKVPDQGRRGSVSEEFLRQVAPKLAVITGVGRQGAAHPTVLEELLVQVPADGLVLLRHGERLKISTDGYRIWVDRP
jgi:competence protein ComEC